MGASPKSKREQPSRRFEDYVLTYEVGPGNDLYPIDDNNLSYLKTELWSIFGPNSKNPYLGQIEDSAVNLGFDYAIDGIIYNKIFITNKGWCLLLDPDVVIGSSYYPDILEHIFDVTNGNGVGNMTVMSKNSYIKNQFVHNHILLAPWFDDLWNSIRNTNDLYAPTYINSISGTQTLFVKKAYPTGTTINDINLGKYPMPPGIKASSGDVKIYKGFSPKEGKIFLARWNSFTSTESTYRFLNICKFELIIFESGKIEFRYSPRQINMDYEGYANTLPDGPGKNEFISFETATVGIFASGIDKGANRYRDLGPILRNQIDSRGIYSNGGSVYDGAYIDNVYEKDKNGNIVINSTNYTGMLKASKHWPGVGQYGAIFRFSPPRLRRRQNRSIVALRESQEFIGRESSFFDDRKAISRVGTSVTQSIEYPSMLPVDSKLRSSGDSFSFGDLHASGSITVTRTGGVTSSASDAIFYDSLIDGRNRR